MMEINKSYSEIRLTPSMRDTIEFCYQNSRDEYSQVVVEIYVEGSQDVEFYTAWVDKSGLDFNLEKLSVVVNEIKYAENDKELVKPELASGNCGRIREYARLNEKYIRIIWISDRDLLKDNELKEYSRDSLFFTDFPAVESYGFSDQILNKLNDDWYNNKLTSLGHCYDFLKHYLKCIYFYRDMCDNQDSPKKLRAWTHVLHDKLNAYRKNCSGDVNIEDFLEYAKEIVPCFVVEKMLEVDDSTVDPRAYAYGHDIAFAVQRFGEVDTSSLKNYPKFTEKHIEQYIRDKYISEELYKYDALFDSLRMRVEYIYDSVMK